MATLVVRDVRKTYMTGEIALKGVELTLEKDEFVAVIGLSGSGKSTLLRCVNRLVEPDSGSVVLNGVEITRLRKQELRRARRDMGMIFQEFNLVERLTVLENVLSGRLGSTGAWRSIVRAFNQADIDLALDICERVGILDHVEKRADQLSGGQRQRVGIARAIIQNPKLLLIDEPTSSLDPKIGREVMDLIWRVAKEDKIPVLISLHDIQFAMRYADRVIGLKGGEKVLDALPAELSEKVIEGVYTVTA
ncbi:MAG: phosphonate ABC transporter ATP-binding protein [Candidatus Methylomirabilia bacterium]